LDILADLECLKSNLTNSLDPFLRVQIRKRGVSIIHNIYTSFDTEYELKDLGKNVNKLISVQVGVRSRTIVKVPLNTIQDISYVHPLTSEITNYYKPKTFNLKDAEGNSKINEMSLINESLKLLIKTYRGLKYTSYHLVLADMIEQFHTIDKINFFEDMKNDQIVFALPLTDITTKLIYTEKYSMKELMKTSGLLASRSLRESYKVLIDTLAQSGHSFDNIRLLKWLDNRVNRFLPRNRTSVSFCTGDKIFISLINNNYICSHYNTADLSILADFPLLKNDLNILNKSFITLGKPINYGGFNLYIRDTMLLAPANSRSLESIGNLYKNEGLSKKDIPHEFLINMSAFLAKDKVAFEEYAMTDTLIVLRHSTEMETFNFTLNKIGIPVTLSSMGKNFVFEK